jgi:DNA-binding beta-propeller fold protein YncE
MQRSIAALLTAFLVAGFASISSADDPPDFVGEWGTLGCCGLGAPDGDFYSPWGLAVAPDGTVYVADSLNDRIQKFSASGTFLGKWGQVDNPRGVATDQAGNVYVADSSHNRVIKFSSSGDSLLAFGSSGSGPGQFSFPWGIAVNAAGQIYVTDNGNNRVQVFAPNGTFQLQFGSTGSGNGQLLCPTGLAIDAQGFVYVSDTCNSRIQKFSPAGFFNAKWGSFGSDPGKFQANYSLSVDINGSVYVADSGNARIQKFTSLGTYLGEWSAAGAGTLSRPAGVAVRPGTGVTLYVSDINDHCAIRYAYPVTAVPGDPESGLRPSVTLAVRPNPVMTRAQVSLTVDPESASSIVRAEVFDSCGRSLRTLADGILGVGDHAFVWDGRDAAGLEVGAGVFFVKVSVDGRPSAAGRIVRLR